jgi:hypothetical protein
MPGLELTGPNRWAHTDGASRPRHPFAGAAVMRRAASSTTECATSLSLRFSCWLMTRRRLKASSADSPLRERRIPMAWSMIGRDDSAACSWSVSATAAARTWALCTATAAAAAKRSPSSAAWSSNASLSRA